MLYTAYEINRRAGAPVVAASGLTARALHALPAPLARTPAVSLRSSLDVTRMATTVGHP